MGLFPAGQSSGQGEGEPVQVVHQMQDRPVDRPEASLNGRDQQIDDPGQENGCV